MDFIKSLIENSWEQIGTLISVCVGGFITYISTVRIESRKVKIKQRYETIRDIIIPCSIYLKGTSDKLGSLQKRICYIDINHYDLDEELAFLKEPLEFLNGDRIYFLPSKLKYALDEYKHKVNSFFDTLNSECSMYLSEYNGYISDKIVDWEYNDSNIDNILVGYARKIDSKVKLIILKKDFDTLSSDISHVRFNDKDYCNGLFERSYSVFLGDDIKSEIVDMYQTKVIGSDTLENRVKRYEDRPKSLSFVDYFDDSKKKEASLFLSSKLIRFLNDSTLNEEDEFYSKIKNSLTSREKLDSLAGSLTETIKSFDSYIEKHIG